MKKPADQDFTNNRRRNIAFGAAIGLVIGGAADMLFGDTGWGLAIGIVVGAIAGYWINFDLPRMEYPPHVVRRMVISGVLFFAALLAAYWLLNRDLSAPYQYIVALLPAIPGGLLAISIGSAISSLDELQRRIQLEAIAIGFGISIVVSMTYALLVIVGAPLISWTYLPVILVFFWLIGKLWTVWKYR